MEPATPEVDTSTMSTPPTPEAKKDNHLITIVAMAAFVLVALVSIAFLFYQNQKLKSMLVSYKNVSTPTPVATPDPTFNWKTYIKDNYQVKYPGDWSVKTINFGFAVTKGDYKINIQTSNPGFGPSICIFSDSLNYNNPYDDNSILAGSKCPESFVEINGDQYVFRRKTTPSVSPNGIPTGKWAIYIKSDNGDFVTVPPIDYSSPAVYDLSTIELMDQILSTFTFINAESTPGTGKSCLYNGKTYKDGETIPGGDKCNSCSCEDGNVACTAMACPD